MRPESLTCGSLHGRAGDCSSVLGHSACVGFRGTGGWRGGCWAQQCPRFPLQKKRRIFLLLPPLSSTTHDRYMLLCIQQTRHHRTRRGDDGEPRESTHSTPVCPTHERRAPDLPALHHGQRASPVPGCPAMTAARAVLPHGQQGSGATAFPWGGPGGHGSSEVLPAPRSPLLSYRCRQTCTDTRMQHCLAPACVSTSFYLTARLGASLSGEFQRLH